MSNLKTKKMKNFIIYLFLQSVTFFSLSVYGQKPEYPQTNALFGSELRFISGNIDLLKTEKSINVQFSYDGMSVNGFTTEARYIKNQSSSRKDSINWVHDWNEEKSLVWKKCFVENFNWMAKKIGLIADTNFKSAKYTLLIRITSLKVGWGGGMGGFVGIEEDAMLKAEIIIYEQQNKDKIIAKLSGDFPGMASNKRSKRLCNAFGCAGYEIGRYLKKHF